MWYNFKTVLLIIALAFSIGFGTAVLVEPVGFYTGTCYQNGIGQKIRIEVSVAMVGENLPDEPDPSMFVAGAMPVKSWESWLDGKKHNRSCK